MALTLALRAFTIENHFNYLGIVNSLGNWSPTDIPANVPRPNLIPFIEPYIEGGSMHPASRLKALQQVQQASQNTRKPSKSKFNLSFKQMMRRE